MLSETFNLRLDFGKTVSIDYTVLDRVCKFLVDEIDTTKYQPFDWRNRKYWPVDREGVSAVSQFFAVGNSINFRYWRMDHKGVYNYCEGKKGGSLERGALYMWRCLKLCYEQGEPQIFDAKKLAHIELSEVSRAFRSDEGYSVMPHLKERQHNWKDLGRCLHEYWNGEFHNLVKQTTGSLFNFVQYSRQFRAFDDPLCKMTMVNAIMHEGRGITKFDRSIFPGIDYQLLKQLIRVGVLIIKGKTKKKIQKRRLLAHQEARELRNAGLHAFLYMMEKAGIRGDIIDNIWWLNRKTCRTDSPLCPQCRFNVVCEKKIEYGIPLEITRHY